MDPVIPSYDPPPAYQEANVGYRPPPHNAARADYQPPTGTPDYKPPVVQPVPQGGNQPYLKPPPQPMDIEKKMYIGIVLGVIGLFLGGFTTILCTLPLIICVIQVMSAKDETEKEAYSRQSLYGGVCALISGAMCFGVMIVIIIASAALRAQASTTE